MQQQELEDLIHKYLSRTATPEEAAALDTWYRQQVDGEAVWMASAPEEREMLKLEMLKNIQRRNRKAMQVHSGRWWLRIAAAVAVLMVLSAGIYFIARHRPAARMAVDTTGRDTIQPGSNGAILTLADGRKIVLEQAPLGALTSQAGAVLQKAADSVLVYKKLYGYTKSDTGKARYNTLETPKGRQFSVVLPDGSHVWLNAASSLSYPTAFTGKERVVELTGEGYFEVVHDDKMPFRVKAAGQVVEDIGTQFNINAYRDEQAVRTTLIEGAVRVSAADKQVLLRPGQQAVHTGQEIQVQPADIRRAVSWKNGYFEFRHEDIRAVMRQFARWYNVEVIFAPGIPQRYFTGDIDRNASVSQALEILSFAKVHFKVQGHIITVGP